MSSALVRQALEFVDQEETGRKRNKKRAGATRLAATGQEHSHPYKQKQHKQKIRKPKTEQNLTSEQTVEENIKKLLALSKPPTDTALAEKSHLLTPFLNPMTEGQHKYNKAQIKTRNVVERQYGLLKRRFPVLAVGIRLKLETAVNVILACSILHNLCILRREADPIDEQLIPNLQELIVHGQINVEVPNGPDPIYGFRRNQLVEYFENVIHE